MEEILRLFPAEMRQAINTKIASKWQSLQEIRFRLHYPVELIFDGKTEWVTSMRPNKQDSIFIVNQLSEFSLYRMEDELREGYITIEGGHRVGLAGKVNTINGAVKAIQYITFLNIRIAKEEIGAALEVIPYMYQKTYLNTLFVGPPQTGKTTIIRDAARLISSGWRNIAPRKVGVIDERSEIGACIKGIPQHDLGLRTDVMDACPKAEGMMMMIRSMSPDVLVIDEIGSRKDVEALMEAINAGVIVICTIHGDTLEDLKKRPSLHSLFQQKVFGRVILLEKHNRPGHIQRIYNKDEKNILQKSGAYRMKWIGALLFIGTTTWVGFEWSHVLNNRPKHIRQLKNALQILEAEILYSQLPLQDAFTTIASQIPEPMRTFFQALSTSMQENNKDLVGFWDKHVNALMKESALGSNEGEILKQFGRTLGQHDFYQQQKHIQLTVSHLDRELEEARDNQFKYSKMAKSLGVLCGLFIVLLLM
ncbi:stage III sporulation protein AA [Virgibacillus sp. NKC19-3]|uniref:stage III sporulation protein AA n=1 Tax=Virgibacillus saliphilus TaxID=2831674 RepID=UPI001C9B3181|nr:stage III sporulation protein AA [Virgibacillus sp. NKC19-3]MBY7143397.1 stage III sporulation protein AA [Virgibacillus sp. NKC19-3]